VRPQPKTIAAPELPARIEWIGGRPESMPALTVAGPTLVHFLDFPQLNSVRTLPYLSEWDRRYRSAGLSTIGVQAHRFPFGADPDVVASGLQDLGVGFPVAIDAERELWHAYGCKGWPSLFLWGPDGSLVWFHFGEGEYLRTEEAIQAELRGIDALRELPAPMDPLRATDGPNARVIAPSPEIFPGGSWQRPWSAGKNGEELQVGYEAGGAFSTVDGEGTLALVLDGSNMAPVKVCGPALYTLAEHQCHESHTITIRPTPGLRIWSIGFAAGVPG